MPVEGNLNPKAQASATHVWLILWKTAHAVEQIAVLEALLHKGSQPVNVIGKKILLTSGSITSAIHRLESRKLVHRTRHPQDRRARLVELTEKGKRLIECAFRAAGLLSVFA
jgi:MarR family 2-MHQ and catechol resistance regulon transcriptional repressor